MGDPFCGACGYSLKGLTDSSKCPECGRPLVEVLERERARLVGRRYVSPTVIFGLPLLHIAIGPHENEPRGRARGIIAIGDVATGWLAIGGFARGLFAFGGMAIGLVAFGGWSVGILIACGGGALGGVAIGGGAVGGLAFGGGAVGVVAEGGGVIGVYAKGGGVSGRYVDSPVRRDPEAQRLFAQIDRWVGATPAAGWRWCAALLGWTLSLSLIVAVPLAALVALGYWRHVRRGPPIR